jgi:large subunit ribosomal protein L6
MSRIGKRPVVVPPDVKVTIENRTVAIEGPKGKLSYQHRPEVAVEFDPAKRLIHVRPAQETRWTKAYHGLTRAVIQNMVTGVTQGYEKQLEIQGVGYLAAIVGKELHLRLGFAHEVHIPLPTDLTVTCPDPQHILIRGIDKQRVGEFAAEIRAIRKADPYLGKGIRYVGEVVRLKERKGAGKK